MTVNQIASLAPRFLYCQFMYCEPLAFGHITQSVNEHLHSHHAARRGNICSKRPVISARFIPVSRPVSFWTSSGDGDIKDTRTLSETNLAPRQSLRWKRG